MNCPDSCYTFAYTASKAEEGIQKRRDDIRSRRFGLELAIRAAAGPGTYPGNGSG